MATKYVINTKRVFLVTWFGQSVSLLGSGLTSFALGVWVFERSGSATLFALIGLCAVLPRILLSPLAGALVDRWDRRRAMALSDAGAGLSTLMAIILTLSGRFEIWHVYLLAGANAAFSAIQWPAYMATTALLVTKENLGRANGLVQLSQAASEILAPILAGALVSLIGLAGVMLIDCVTFLFAVAALLLVRFPQPETASITAAATQSFWEQMSYGWKYIARRPGLFGLLGLLAAVNFLWGMVGALIVPMVLSFASSQELGALLSIAGLGMLAGSLAMSAWGGPKRRIHGVLLFEIFSGACFLLMGWRAAFWPVAIGAFGAHVTIAIVYGCNQAIWQSKVAPGAQGRVFAAQQMLLRAASPLAYLLAGPLTDKIFEPLMSAGGALSASAGQVVGVGPGRGIGMLFVLMGAVKIALPLIGYRSLRIRRVEDELPDAVPGEAMARAG
ncbi:MAG: MFS transporter [Anaerolineales bacterium]|nr:MFS transporter [Anaerolineales bacterium]